MAAHVPWPSRPSTLWPRLHQNAQQLGMRMDEKLRLRQRLTDLQLQVNRLSTSLVDDAQPVWSTIDIFNRDQFFSKSDVLAREMRTRRDLN